MGLLLGVGTESVWVEWRGFGGIVVEWRGKGNYWKRVDISDFF